VSSPLGTPSQRRRKQSAARRRPGSRGPPTQLEADSDAVTVTVTVKSVRGRLGRCDGRRDGDHHRDLALKRHRDLALKRHRDLALRRHRDLALRRHRDLALKTSKRERTTTPELSSRSVLDCQLLVRPHSYCPSTEDRNRNGNVLLSHLCCDLSLEELPAIGSPPLSLSFHLARLFLAALDLDGTR
jgi:hypothetical protein